MLEPEALHLFDELSDLKLLPNIVTFGATVTACEKGGVLHVHRLMCARPDVDMHRTAECAYGATLDSRQIININSVGVVQ